MKFNATLNLEVKGHSYGDFNFLFFYWSLVVLTIKILIVQLFII